MTMSDATWGRGDRWEVYRLALSLSSDDADSILEVAVVGTGRSAVRVAPEDLGHFIVLHSDRVFVCHGVGRWFWALVHHLRADKSNRAVEDILWEMARTFRLVDTQILDQLLSRAVIGVDRGARDL